ncbi:hypothetical protein NL676_022759 [Syzygium grande]|nr:hypothetical protein NL676_022759 [Syzygium grande]
MVRTRAGARVFGQAGSATDLPLPLQVVAANKDQRLQEPPALEQEVGVAGDGGSGDGGLGTRFLEVLVGYDLGLSVDVEGRLHGLHDGELARCLCLANAAKKSEG